MHIVIWVQTKDKIWEIHDGWNVKDLIMNANGIGVTLNFWWIEFVGLFLRLNVGSWKKIQLIVLLLMRIVFELLLEFDVPTTHSEERVFVWISYWHLLFATIVVCWILQNPTHYGFPTNCHVASAKQHLRYQLGSCKRLDLTSYPQLMFIWSPLYLLF